MNVFLTFDVEIWCNDWHALDARFPAAFERYVYGRSPRGDYALPKTLEFLDRHGLRGVFFVEPLFAARFGERHLETVTQLILAAGQEVQLHLHPEWTDELRPAPFPDKPYKRQYLTQYSRDEQAALVRRGLELLASAGCREVTAFRAGSFAANIHTLEALRDCGLGIDSSLNMCYPVSGIDLRGEGDFYHPRRRGDLLLLPISVFRDGLGRLRHAQVGACSSAELAQAMDDAERRGHPCFTILSHNFEMLRPRSSRPDPIVAARFDALCRFLAANRERLPTTGMTAPPAGWPSDLPAGIPLARTSRLATLGRYVGQAARRLQ